MRVHHVVVGDLIAGLDVAHRHHVHATLRIALVGRGLAGVIDEAIGLTHQIYSAVDPGAVVGRFVDGQGGIGRDFTNDVDGADYLAQADLFGRVKSPPTLARRSHFKARAFSQHALDPTA